MGQARLKRENFRRELLEKSLEWDFPASQWEADICADFREEDIIVVPRASPEQLTWGRMAYNECHANARWYAENDPSGKSQAISGWWVQWPNFVLHSVVEVNGRLICITPSLMNEVEIPFIPDKNITWIEDGGKYSALKFGHRIGVGVRKYPGFTMAQNKIMRERMLVGIDPFKAAEFSDKELEYLIEKYTCR